MASEKISATPAPRSLRSVLGLPSPAGSRFIDGCPIAWYQFPTATTAVAPGSAPSRQTVVCLHDIGSGSREYRPLIDNLPAGIRLVLFDWPRHGRSGDCPTVSQTVDSYAALIAAVLGQLQIANPILLASGFAAAAAIQFAAQNPVKGLILCQPAGLFPPRRTTKSPAAASRAAKSQALRIEALRPQMRAIRAEAEASLAVAESTLQATLSTLKCPILFVFSRDNRRYPLKQYLSVIDAQLARSPQHKVTVFSGGFHPIWDSDRFAPALTAYIQSLLPLSEHTHAWLLAAVDWPARSTNLWKCVHPDCPKEQILPEGQDPNIPSAV